MLQIPFWLADFIVLFQMATFVDNEVVRSIIHLLLEEDKAQLAWVMVILLISNFLGTISKVGSCRWNSHDLFEYGSEFDEFGHFDILGSV